MTDEAFWGWAKLHSGADPKPVKSTHHSSLQHDTTRNVPLSRFIQKSTERLEAELGEEPLVLARGVALLEHLLDTLPRLVSEFRGSGCRCQDSSLPIQGWGGRGQTMDIL